jgi:flagellar basal-body rod protein FlgC
MALDRIATSGLQAHLRAAENAAHNVSQVNVEEPALLRTRFRAGTPPPAGGGGVRAETEVERPESRPSSAPVLHPDIQESFVRDEVDLVQEFTDLLVAQRGFQANLATERASRSFFDATFNLSA